MSGIAYKQAQMRDFFRLHPDSRAVTPDGDTARTFPALFNNAFKTSGSDGGNIQHRKMQPHLTFYSEYSDEIRRGTVLDIEGAGRTYTVAEVSPDQTGATFQGEAWLV